ncbi:hypothetical protein NB640_12360 [Oxalobacter vibrioformis]|uniref:Uncharacterized protein n=1 Tax=Oxalobacter vibrioformis TaxID=933080 RepID=A0A9E9LZA5_9BURK|nr:hypothetical protein [Oxalobacter vibrioformis]WAW09993.1 hypothetical protein NB640_12360 [Oxalobacter vibrioformis]
MKPRSPRFMPYLGRPLTAPTKPKRERKHSNIIKQWLDGADIEVYSKTKGRWVPAGEVPRWGADKLFRVKGVPLLWEKEQIAQHEGKAVEARVIGSSFGWHTEPSWEFDSPKMEYRVKPVPVVRDVVVKHGKIGITALWGAANPNVRFTFDPETGLPLSVELLKE